LLEIKPDDIDISERAFERAFKYACFQGHLQVIKWLLEVKPDIDISVDNDYAFRKASVNENLEIAKLLVELNPDKYQLETEERIVSFSISQKKFNADIDSYGYSYGYDSY
jgi:ankyrin repeat protein